MLFVAAFFVGKEVLEIADLYVKKKLQETYTTTLDIHKAGIQKGIATGKKTIAFHKKMLGIDELEFSPENTLEKKKRKK